MMVCLEITIFGAKFKDIENIDKYIFFHDKYMEKTFWGKFEHSQISLHSDVLHLEWLLPN